MHLAYRLAIVLCLSVPAAGWQAEHQDPASSENPAGQPQVPPTPKGNAPAEPVPAETPPVDPANPHHPAAEEKVPENVAKEKTDAGTASGAKKRRKRKAPAPNGAPRKIVVREGGASEPAAQIAPGLTLEEATRQRHNAEQLLGATDDKLKRLAGRTLDAKQQETVGQIRNYMDGARSALKEGDVRRANTLAQKAHLLSEDLVKH
jgi:hypothetical protein